LKESFNPSIKLLESLETWNESDENFEMKLLIESPLLDGDDLMWPSKLHAPLFLFAPAEMIIG